MKQESSSSPNSEESRALFPHPKFRLLSFAEVFREILRRSGSRCLDWLKRIPSESVRLCFDAEESPKRAQPTVDVAIIFPLDFSEWEPGPNIAPHVDNRVTMPAARPRLTFPRPHADRKYLAQNSRLEAVPFFLEIFDRKTAWQGEEENPDVILAGKLDEINRRLFSCDLNLDLLLLLLHLSFPR